MAKEQLPVLQEASEVWAFSFEETEHLNWSKGLDQLSYDWTSIELPKNISKQIDITILVAKRYPEKSIDAIRRITQGIRKIPKIKIGTPVLGITKEKRVSRAGIITNKSIVEQISNKVSLDIAWNYEFDTENTYQSFLDVSEGFEKLNKTKISKLSLSNKDLIKDDGTELKSILARIQRRWLDKYKIENLTQKDFIDGPLFKLMDDKPRKSDSSILYGKAYKRKDPKEDGGNTLTLFYGTNRNKLEGTDLNNFYGSEISQLKTGFCKVSIPQGHIQGKLERPFKVWKISFPESQSKHIVLKNIKELDKDKFFRILKDNLKGMKRKVGMVFIHGYNNSFAEAAWRTAQITYDLPFKGISGFFSWPSAGGSENYLKDIENADASISILKNFLKSFIDRTEVEEVHLISHSMGSRILVQVIRDLEKNNSNTHYLKIIQQLILAAPDLDPDVFKNEILPHFCKAGIKRTLYASDKDFALLGSGFIRGKPRLGWGGNHLFVVKDIDTIDASNVPVKGLAKHGYIFETKELLTDIYLLINNNLDPSDRRLRNRMKNHLPYWIFPK